jgi:hypothetical protein
MEFFVARHARE